MNLESLDEHLSRLARDTDAPSALPEQVIDDYVRGRANPEDQKLVEAAMARSAELREEIFSLTAVANGGAAFARLVPPPAPARRRLRSPAPLPRRPFPLRQRPTPLLAFCGLLAIAVAAWLFGPVSPIASREDPAIYAAAFDRTLTDEQFEAGIERTPNTPSFPAPSSPRDAVLISLFKVIEWNDGRFLIHPAPPEAGGERKYELTFNLERPGGTTTVPYTVRLPREARDPQTAILVFPDLALHWVETHEWDGRAVFKQDPGQTLFLTVAYRLGDTYRASVPTTVSAP